MPNSGPIDPMVASRTQRASSRWWYIPLAILLVIVLALTHSCLIPWAIAMYQLPPIGPRN